MKTLCSLVFHIRLFHPDRRKSSQNLVERIYVTVTHASKYCHISQVKKYIAVNDEFVGMVGQKYTLWTWQLSTLYKLWWGGLRRRRIVLRIASASLVVVWFGERRFCITDILPSLSFLLKMNKNHTVQNNKIVCTKYQLLTQCDVFLEGAACLRKSRCRVCSISITRLILSVFVWLDRPESEGKNPIA